MTTDFGAEDVLRIVVMLEYVQRNFRDLYSVSPNVKSREILVLLHKSTNGDYPHFFINMDTGMIVIPRSDIADPTRARVEEHRQRIRELAQKPK